MVLTWDKMTTGSKSISQDDREYMGAHIQCFLRTLTNATRTPWRIIDYEIHLLPLACGKKKEKEERGMDPARVFLLLKTGSLSYLC